MIFFQKASRFSFRVFLPLLILSIVPMVLTGCDIGSNYLKTDREGNLEFQDYRDGLSSRVESAVDEDDREKKRSNIPDLQPYISRGQSQLTSMPLVSISINQTVPLRDALFELAQQADYDIELDPRIRGSIIFTAREKPLDKVIDRISEIAGLRYDIEDTTLRIELDLPYNKLYKIDYLSYVRTSDSSMTSNISVVSGEGVNTGSSFDVGAQSESDFWGELEANLEQIINRTQTGGLKTSRDPRITATQQNPNVQAVSPQGDGSVNVQAPDAVLNVSSLPVDGEEDDPLGFAGGGSGEDDDLTRGSFTLNRQAGIINVYAPRKAHDEIQEYLTLLKQAVTAQVLIEARVLEVTLNDEFVTGIDWGGVDFFGGEGVVDFLTNGTSRAATTLLPATSAGLTGTGIATNTNFVLGYTGNDVQALIEALSGFGTVKALASPRLTVLNNQPAVLNVATNRVFFEIDVETEEEEDGGGGQSTTIDIDSDIRNVPEGVLINVLPSVDLQTKTISMAVRPTITSVVREIADPGVQFVTAANDVDGVESLIPELSVQEIDSVILVRSGQPVVMGGLLQDRSVSQESAVPILGEAPVIGSLFKDTDDLITKTEVVIFLKATILDTPSASIHNTDKDLYRRFSSDRRPLRF